MVAARSVRALFDAYWDADPADRAALLREVAAEEPVLADRLQRLIAADADVPAEPARPRLPEAIVAGSRLGDFRVTQVLGHGGMGSVFLAVQEQPVRREVALKVMPWQASRDPERRARFTAERQALASLSHPNVASFHAAGETDDGIAYFAMEHVAGSHIDDYCRQRGLGIGERLGLMRQVCAGVAHAHRKGVIHRDLKPANVLVTEQSGQRVVKIIDFGVAKAMAEGLRPDAFETHAGRIVGTLNYLAPEQAREAGRTDTRADVYALGALLYRLLAGRTPFDFRPEEESLGEIFRRLENEEPKRPSELVTRAGAEAVLGVADGAALAASLRGDLDWICLRAVARDPGRRYPSADDLARDLLAFLEDRPVEARPPTLSYRWSKFFARNRASVLALGTVFLVALFTAAWSLHQARRVQAEAATANEVISLMREAFSAADPDDAQGREITVYDVLDRAAAKLAALDEASPARARLASELAEVYGNLGRAREALVLWDMAHALHAHLSGARSPEAIAALTGKAVALRQLSRFEESEAAHTRVLTLQQQIHGGDSPEALRARMNLAGLHQKQMRHDRALPLLEEAYSSARAVHGDAHPDTLKIAANLAVALKAGDPVRAIELTEHAVAGLRREMGEDRIMILGLEYNLVTMYGSAGRTGDALARIGPLRARADRVLGAEHPLALSIREYEGVLARKAGDPDRAIATIEAVYAIRRSQVGPDHLDTLRIEGNLLELRLERGDAPGPIADGFDALLARLGPLVRGGSLVSEISANAVKANIAAGRFGRAGQLFDGPGLAPGERARLLEAEPVSRWLAARGD